MAMGDLDKWAWHRLGKVNAQEMVLVLYLDNAATNRQWFEQMVKATPQKKDRKTGEMKPGISERTFNRQRKEIVARGHVVVSGTGQGKIYSIVAGPWSEGGSSGSGFADRQALQGTAKALSGFGSGSSPDRMARHGLIAQALRHTRLKDEVG
jgi:hypothetical protein